MKLEKSLIITIISVFILGVVSTLVYQASNGNNKGNSIKVKMSLLYQKK